MNTTKNIDEITRTCTAMRSFAELVECGLGGYNPTLIDETFECIHLRHAFDLAMNARGCASRSWPAR